MQVDPLQLAIAYAAIGNGGTLLRPHVGMQVDDSAGRVVQEIDPPAAAPDPDRPRATASAILDGLHAAAQSPGGTSYGVFGGFPVPVAGKTGTAERPGQEDQSWYVGPGALPEAAGRRRGDGRAGRVRRRLRGADRAADPLRSTSTPGPSRSADGGGNVE